MTQKKRSAPTRKRPTRDRVLQARIPAQLDEELRNRALRLGLSVSTVVRNVLLNTFDLVENAITDSVQVAQSLHGNGSSAAPAGKGASSTAVVGWQELTLNLNAVCGQCNALLPKGSRAGVGLPMSNPAAFLCLQCLASTGANRSRAQKNTGGKP